MLELDHLVVTAPDLTAGLNHVEAQTGIAVPKGGEHPLMGTHNHLARLGADEFLEVIAVNPQAPPPARPRWYGLDDPEPQPRLSHWVLRTGDMAGTHPRLPECLGPALAVSRGDLRWLLTVPADGALPMQGAMPSVIDWQADPIPPVAMPDVGAQVMSLTISHPRVSDISDALSPFLSDDRFSFTVGPVGLRAELQVLDQIVTLS